MSPRARPEAAGCLVCRIARGAEPAAVVLESPAVVAFLDRRPLFRGHCLVVPREHVETLGDLPPHLIAPFFEIVGRLARVVETALAADGSFVAMNTRVSQSVPHRHAHVVPRRRGDGLRGFFWPLGHYASAEEMEVTRRRISLAAGTI